MKKFGITISTLAVAALFLAVTSVASAAGTMKSGDSSKMESGDIYKLNAEISMINLNAQMPEADQVIAKQLADEFKVSPDRINGLMLHNMQYGDVAGILAFAEHLPGGINNTNVNQVMEAKTSKGSWDRVAQNFKDVDTSSVLDRLSGLEESIHREIKTALAESAEGKAAGGVNESLTPDRQIPGNDTETYEGTGGESGEGLTGEIGPYEGTGGPGEELESGDTIN